MGASMSSGGPKTLGVSLSGGGHRASLWATGALLGLVDAGVHPDVVSIASVSGGSIANGVLAAQLDYTGTCREEMETKLSRAIQVWAHEGLFFPGPRTDAYVAGTLFRAALLVSVIVGALTTFAALGRSWPFWSVAAGGILTLVLSLAGGLFLAAKLPEPVRAATVSGTVVSTIVVIAGLALARVVHGWVAVLVAGVFIAVVVIAWRSATSQFSKRSEVVDDAMSAELFAADGSPIRLSASGPPMMGPTAKPPLHHVFCATNLATADHIYLSPKLIYGYGLGSSPPNPTLKLSTAVQVSACLPGAFAPRRLDSNKLAAGLTDATVVLTDGGVYDNMADQWEFGFADRAVRVPGLAQMQDPAATLIVVNASKAFTHQPIKGKRLLGEILALLRCKDVLYDVSTSVRRRYLVDTFQAGGRLKGVLVHITQTPTTVPKAFQQATETGLRARAGEALGFLTKLNAIDPTNWTQIAETNAAIKTTLGPIGAKASADLLQHSYVLARVNAFVILDRGTLPTTTATDAEILQQWGRQRFEALVGSSQATGRPKSPARS